MTSQASSRFTIRTSRLVARLAMTAVLLAAAAPVNALVNYDTGQRIDRRHPAPAGRSSDPLAYYYLPQYPRLSTKADGTLEFAVPQVRRRRPAGRTAGSSTR